MTDTEEFRRLLQFCAEAAQASAQVKVVMFGDRPCSFAPSSEECDRIAAVYLGDSGRARHMLSELIRFSKERLADAKEAITLAEKSIEALANDRQ